jgi:methylenetetrahydrofolate reductase (NADPH)
LKLFTTKKQLIALPKIFHLDIPEELNDAVNACKTNADVQKVSVE